MTQHRQLLTDYAEHGSEEAFRELVSAYIGLVHASATRLTDGDSHRAQDIAQTVFADLARFAPTLSREISLGGWLHRRTCHVAMTVMRSERRRENRERQAVEMNSLHENPDENLAQIAPVLDDAINELNADDRNAVMLRFFERCDLRTIGEALGSNEDAAQKRISRALEKLRGLLARRGVVLSATALTLALGSEAACAAPAGLAVSVSTGALAVSHASSGFSLTTLKMLVMTKLKATAIAAISVALVAGVGTTVAVMRYQSGNGIVVFKPPTNPEPQKILAEAEIDGQSGRYAEALGKHIWIHEKSLQYRPSFVGVRNSFALTAWGVLAKKYPLAMEKLKALRDQAEKTVRNQSKSLKERTDAFSEIVGVNLSFREDEKVAALFTWLDSNAPEVAQRVSMLAERSLIATRNYKLYGRYIEPNAAYQGALRIYNQTKKISQTHPEAAANGRMAEMANKTFATRTATMVAILVLNDRKAEAEQIAADAAKEWNDPGFQTQLEDAKNGVVPAQWP